MSFAKMVSEDRRLVVLKLLAGADEYSCNHHLLHTALPGLGHNCSEDTLLTELDWLAEQGLVTREKIGGVTIAKLTGRGEDVQAGRARVTGVKRPRPE